MVGPLIAPYGDLPPEPHARHLGLRCPAALRRLVPPDLRVLYRRPRDPRGRPRQRHPLPYRCVGRSAAPRGYAVRQRTAVLDPGQRWQVRARLRRGRHQRGYGRGPDPTQVAQPERDLRALPRRPPPRVPGSCPAPWGGPPTPRARRMGGTLQRGATAPGDRAADPEPAAAAWPRRALQAHRGLPGVGRDPPRLPKGGVGRPHPSRMNEVARTLKRLLGMKSARSASLI